MIVAIIGKPFQIGLVILNLTIMTEVELSDFETNDDPTTLEQLLTIYSSLPGSQEDIRNDIARRIAKTSLQRDVPAVTKDRLARVISMANLTPKLANILSLPPDSSTFQRCVAILSVDTAAFKNSVQEAIRRINSVENTVSQFTKFSVEILLILSI